MAVAVLAGLTLIPRCATRSRYGAVQTGAWKSEADTGAAGAMGATSATGATEGAAKVEAGTPAPAAVAVTAPVTSSASPADPFRETIRPILSARCGHCHDPGGRMYARLPFDDPQVVSSHSEGVLRRLKGEDRAAMEKWLAGLADASPPR